MGFGEALGPNIAIFYWCADLAVRNDGLAQLISTYGWPFTIEEYVEIDFDQLLISYRDLSDIPDTSAKIERTTIEFKYSSLILNVLVVVGIACFAVFIARCFVRALCRRRLPASR